MHQQVVYDELADFAVTYLGTSDVDDVRNALFGDDGLELIAKMSPDPSTLSTPGAIPSQNRPGKYFKPKSSVSRSSKTAPTPPTKPTVSTGSLRPTGGRISRRSKPVRTAVSAKPTSVPKAVRPTAPSRPILPTKQKVAKGVFPKMPFGAKIASGVASTAHEAGAGTAAGKKAGRFAGRLERKVKEVHGPVREWERKTGRAAAGTAAAGGGYLAYKKGRNIVQDYRYNNDLYVPGDVPDQFRKSDQVFECDFSKVDEDKHQVFGWASIVTKDGKPVVDRQGDWINAEEMEKSAYEYVLKSRRGGNEHRRDADQAFHASDLIESFVLTGEKREKMGLPADGPTGWWVGFKVNDEGTWQDVKSGKVSGFSIHGKGKRQAMNVLKPQATSDMAVS